MGACSCEGNLLIKEEKMIYNFFNHLCKFLNFSKYLLDRKYEKDLNFDILNYDEVLSFIKANSANNFKILVKKQNVRLGFIKEVEMSIFMNLDRKTSNDKSEYHIS